MRTIAKSMLGALALATAALVAAPAGAATVTVTTTHTVHAVPGTCMRTGFCGHRDFYGHEMRREAMMRHIVRHERHEAVRQAFLEHRYERNY